MQNSSMCQEYLTGLKMFLIYQKQLISLPATRLASEILVFVSFVSWLYLNGLATFHEYYSWWYYYLMRVREPDGFSSWCALVAVRLVWRVLGAHLTDNVPVPVGSVATKPLWWWVPTGLRPVQLVIFASLSRMMMSSVCRYSYLSGQQSSRRIMRTLKPLTKSYWL
jgi:hypothetical protein